MRYLTFEGCPNGDSLVFVPNLAASHCEEAGSNDSQMFYRESPHECLIVSACLRERVSLEDHVEQDEEEGDEGASLHLGKD